MIRFRPLSMVPIALYACAKPDPTPTWTGEVAPIIADHCAICHRDGGVAPYAFTDYTQAVALAASMPSVLQSGFMPPWRADASCRSYADDLALSADDQATIIGWATGGTPLGDGVDSAEPGAYGITSIDAILALTTPWTPVETPDEERCFLFPYEGGDGFVTGLWADPGDPQEVELVRAFVVAPADLGPWEALDDTDPADGWSCGGDPGGNALPTTWLGTWTPGEKHGDFPAGTGIPIAAGSKVGVQIHYHVATGRPDSFAMELSLASTVEHRASWVTVADPTWPAGITVPAGSTGAAFTYEDVVSSAVTVYAAEPVERDFGTAATLDSSAGCLVDVPAWDPDWQRAYAFSTPQSLAAGDTVDVTCTYANPGATDVLGGDGPGQETCRGMLYATTN